MYAAPAASPAASAVGAPTIIVLPLIATDLPNSSPKSPSEAVISAVSVTSHWP